MYRPKAKQKKWDDNGIMDWRLNCCGVFHYQMHWNAGTGDVKFIRAFTEHARYQYIVQSWAALGKCECPFKFVFRRCDSVTHTHTHAGTRCARCSIHNTFSETRVLIYLRFTHNERTAHANTRMPKICVQRINDTPDVLAPRHTYSVHVQRTCEYICQTRTQRTHTHTHTAWQRWSFDVGREEKMVLFVLSNFELLTFNF